MQSMTKREKLLTISIHALLAESDFKFCRKLFALSVFLSTLSLRRATSEQLSGVHCQTLFLSTLSLRRATVTNYYGIQADLISIHALLAESDSNPL